MSAARDAFVAALRVAATGPWTVVSSTTVRFTWTLETPAHMRAWPSLWPGGKPIDYGPTYDRHVFVTGTARQPIVRVCRAPWVTCTDVSVSYRRACEILADPETALDPPRKVG